MHFLPPILVCGRHSSHRGKPLPNERQVAARAATWRPWRAYATLHLWQTLHDASLLK
jgi:3-methyladenine DNA glycosylase/8-oxoguanine DNA glycosylase